MQVLMGQKAVIGAVASAFLIGAPAANAGYDVTLSGEEVTAVANASTSGCHPSFCGHFRLLEWDHQSEYQPPREWEVWPATGVDPDLLDGDPEDENCRPSSSNLGSDPAMKCEDVTLLDVTGSAGVEVVHAGTVEDPDETNHARATSVVGNLAGGNDYWSIGDNLTGDHDVAGGAGTDLLELPDSSWSVDLQSNSVASGDYSVEISGFENLRLNWVGEPDTNNSVFGSDGPNEIEVSSGNGTVHGRAGDDSLEVDEGNGNAYGEQGNDGLDVGFFAESGDQQYAEGGAGDDSIHAWGEDITVAHGGPGDDDVFGFSRDFDGTDTSSNSVTGGTGNDLVSASSSATTVGRADGGEGDDTVWGDEGNDQLNGGTGNAAGDDVTGYGGNDTIVVDPTASNTTLTGDGSEFVPSGNPPGADNITGSDGADQINGGGQPDTINARSGNDTISGDNATTPETTDPDGGDTINAGAGADTVFSRGGNDRITGGTGNDQLNGGTGTDDEVTGSGGNDTITVDSASTGTLLVGDTDEVAPTDPPGTDTITGSAGVDRINGGGQADTITAGAGNDTIFGDNNTTSETSAEIRIADPDGGDTINAGNGADTVFGRGGDDTITGGPGDDDIDCGDGTDQVVDPEPNDTLTNCEGELLEVRISDAQTGAAGDTFPITLTFENKSADETLESLTPVNQYGFGVASSYYTDPGDIQVVSGPNPAFPATLEPGESSTHTITVKATNTGSVGLEAKATATGADSDDEFEDTHYGEVVIGETQPDAGQNVGTTSTGIALFLERASRTYREQQDRYADWLYQTLAPRLSPKARLNLFGAVNQLKITNYEHALARWRGMSPTLMAVMMPNKPKLYENGNIYLNSQQVAKVVQHDGAEMLRLTDEYFGGLTKSATDLVANESRYWAQLGSEEGRGRIAADIATYAELNNADLGDLGTALKDASTYEGWHYGLQKSDEAVKKGLEGFLNNLIASDQARVDELAHLAETDPNAFIEQVGKNNAGIAFEGLKLTGENLFGDGLFHFAGKAFTGTKAALGKMTDAIGLTKPKGAKTLAKTTAIAERTATIGPSYLDDLDDEAKQYIALRKMDDIGGMPKGDVEITQDIVDKTNKRLKELGYTDTEIEVLFRPANPFKVEDAFAKVETVGVKNIAPIDLALGAPPSTLAETAVFKPRNPESLPGFKNYSELDKTLLKERYTTRLEEYRQFHGFDLPKGKMLEMLKAFGKEPHVFDNIGKGREIKMRLKVEKVGETTVLKYDYLEVQGKTLINGKGKPRAIGTDYDQAAIIDKKTRELLKGQRLTAAEQELARQGEKAAVKSNYANPFHGATAHGTDANAADYPFFAHYWLTHLKKADAIREAKRLADNYNKLPSVAKAIAEGKAKPITADDILKKTAGLFERHLLRINAADASFGPSDVTFTTPAVVPR